MADHPSYCFHLSAVVGNFPLPVSICKRSHVTTPVADQPTTSTPSGHLFLVRCRLKSIACSAVIVPTSSTFRPRYTRFSVWRTGRHRPTC